MHLLAKGDDRMKKVILHAKESAAKQGLDEIKKVLEDLKVPSKEISKTLLSCEEVLFSLIKSCDDENEQISISFYKYSRKVDISFYCKGQDTISIEQIKQNSLYSDESMDVESKIIVNKMCDKILGENISIQNTNGINIVNVKVNKERMSLVMKTLISLILAIIVSLILKTFVAKNILDGLNSNLFTPIYSMFLSALKMVIAPLVFFSIASSISEYENIQALGKLAIKVVCFYLCTSVIAIGIGYLVFTLFPIGDSSMLDIIGKSSETVVANKDMVSTSIKDIIVNIIPSDSISAFLNTSMLQIIFMGILLGIGVSKLGKKNSTISKFVAEGNQLFINIMDMITVFLPLAVFCSIQKLILGTDTKNILKMLQWIPVCWLGQVFMFIVYCILLAVVGKLNPFKFLKGFGPAILTGFAMCSSNATMPTSLKMCDKKLGISKKIYSFSIPLGTTINMDGFCITLLITVLYLARVYGMNISTSVLFSLFVSVMALSVGCPGVNGAMLVCLSLLLSQVNIPLEAMILIIALEPFTGMAQVATNVSGDAAISAIIANRNGLLDKKIYNAN